MLNGYTVEFLGVATRVDLLGSNNDIIDVLIPTGVSIVPSNSAGLQIVVVGGVGTPAEVGDAVWQHADGVINTLAAKVMKGRQEWDPITGILTIYDTDDVAVLLTYLITDENDIISITRALKRTPQ
jgi:hypothetical protein